MALSEPRQRAGELAWVTERLERAQGSWARASHRIQSIDASRLRSALGVDPVLSAADVRALVAVAQTRLRAA